jgi:hypothetical protein
VQRRQRRKLSTRIALDPHRQAYGPVGVHLPTTDGRELGLTRYTEPEPELRHILNKLKLAPWPSRQQRRDPWSPDIMNWDLLKATHPTSFHLS